MDVVLSAEVRLPVASGGASDGTYLCSPRSSCLLSTVFKSLGNWQDRTLTVEAVRMLECWLELGLASLSDAQSLLGICID